MAPRNRSLTNGSRLALLRRSFKIATVAGVTIAVAAGIAASSGVVRPWEQTVFHVINNLPEWLRAPMWVLQLAGLLLVPLLVALPVAATRRFRLAGALVALIPLKLFVEKDVVKQLVQRQRPGTSICDMDLTCGHFRDVPVVGPSFVSGHAIIAFGVATLLVGYLRPPWRHVVLGVAVGNAIARVYLGAHNVLDVVGGGAIGVALGSLLALAVGLPADISRRSTDQPHQGEAAA